MNTKAEAQDTARILAMYRDMLRIRRFEEEAAEGRTRGDVLGPVHPSIGQEAVPVGVCANLLPTDIITSTHRGHGHVLAKGARPPEMFSELFGRADGNCGGKGGSMHIADVSVGVFGANGIVGAGINIAVGAAHAAKIQGQLKVVVCFHGDGAVNRGPFLEGLNWSKVNELPVLFVCEDNTFASGTRSSTVTSGGGPAARAEALGIPALTVDGNDILAVDAATEKLVSRIRAGEGPQFLHCKTYRLHNHTLSDVRQVVRPSNELDDKWKLEPVLRCAATLMERGVSEAELEKVRQDVLGEMAAAVAHASAAPWPTAASAFNDIQDAGAPTWRG